MQPFGYAASEVTLKAGDWFRCSPRGCSAFPSGSSNPALGMIFSSKHVDWLPETGDQAGRWGSHLWISQLSYGNLSYLGKVLQYSPKLGFCRSVGNLGWFSRTLTRSNFERDTFQWAWLVRFQRKERQEVQMGGGAGGGPRGPLEEWNSGGRRDLSQLQEDSGSLFYHLQLYIYFSQFGNSI